MHDDQYTVAVHFLRVLTDYCESQGLPAQTLLAEQQLSPSIIADQQQRIPYLAFDRMLRSAEQHLNDERVGLHAGSHGRLIHSGSSGMVLLASATGRQALPRMTHYGLLNLDAFSDEVVLVGDRVTLNWRCQISAENPLSHHHAELYFAYSHACIPQLAGVSATPAGVGFRHAAPANPQPLEEYFGCPVAFGEPVDWLAYPVELLDLTISGISDADMLTALDAICEQQLKAISAPQDQDWLQACRGYIVRALLTDGPTLAAAAASASLTERQLRRRLTAEKLNFRSLVDDVRCRLAGQYLADPSFSLAEISLMLGYSEQSAFQRAYQRWHGETPQQARAGLSKPSSHV